MTGNNMSSGVYTGFLNGSAGKESACKADDTGDAALIPGWERFPRGGKWQPTSVFLPGEFHGRRSPVSHSSKGHKEQDTTELLSIQQDVFTFEGEIHD